MNEKEEEEATKNQRGIRDTDKEGHDVNVCRDIHTHIYTHETKRERKRIRTRSLFSSRGCECVCVCAYKNVR